MPSTQTTLPPPPVRFADWSQPVQQWHFSLQRANPLIEVDTSSGNVTEALPAAGLNPSTGQTNQNVELTYVKTSGDANTVTITGAQSGIAVWSAQFQLARFKSNGRVWYRVG